MKKFIILLGFVLGNFSILLISFLFLTVYSTKNSVAVSYYTAEDVSVTLNENDVFLKSPEVFSQEASFLFVDTRTATVDSFFKKYRSPMIGLGKYIVTAADKYNLSYKLLPAIGACEGALGQRIPINSYNTWGWGIYGGKITYFSSWQEAIETVSKGLKTDYFDKGLDTPEKIMSKYTPSSQTWATCVNRYLEEM